MRFFITWIFMNLHHRKPFWVGDFGAKTWTCYLNFLGTRHHLISDAHGECAHQFLTCTLSARIIYASVPYAHVQYVLKGGMRNFGNPNEPINILTIFYFNPKVGLPLRLYGVKIMKIWAIEISHLGTIIMY